MKKKRGIEIKIQLSNRWIYTLIVIGVLAIVGVGVYAFVGPSGVGHELNEIKPCAEGEILQTNADETAWECVNMPNEIEPCGEGETLQVVDGEWSCVEIPKAIGGLYGWCSTCPGETHYPAFCGGYSCLCATGYTKRALSPAGTSPYTCVKISS